MVPRSDGLSCPVCEGPTEFLGAVDFNRACSETQGFRLPPSGQMISYRACPACGFAFAPEMWTWPEAEFAERIYNADYVLVDPDYVADRPDGNAGVVQAIFPEAAASARHLDYGGGNG